MTDDFSYLSATAKPQMTDALPSSLTIRPVQLSDAPGLAEIYAWYVEHTHYTFECDVPDAAELRRRIQETTEFFPFFVCEDEENGEILGYAAAHPYHEREAFKWVCETAIYIKNGKSGLGIGTALYEKLLTALQKQGFCKAVAVLGCPNEGSAAFHRSLGFSSAAVLKDMGYKLGDWHDIEFYVLELNTAADCHVEPPVSFPSICGQNFR